MGMRYKQLKQIIMVQNAQLADSRAILGDSHETLYRFNKGYKMSRNFLLGGFVFLTVGVVLTVIRFL